MLFGELKRYHSNHVNFGVQPTILHGQYNNNFAIG